MNATGMNRSQQPLNVRSLLTRFCAAWLLFAWLALPLGAQETPSSPLPPGRFLFMVDTSLSMRARADGLLQTVEALLASGLDGRLRPGDSIGLWTFNQEVYAGRFPLQTWTPTTRTAVTANVLEFLRNQRYEKKTDLDQVLRKALPLVRGSQAITLVLFTDGEEPVRGTPFDDDINAVFRESRREQARVRMPFVTVLRAENRQFARHVVGLPPWRIQIPPLPIEEKAIAAAKSPPTVPAKPLETKPMTKPAEPRKSELPSIKLPPPVATPRPVVEKTPEAKPVEKPLVATAGPASAAVTASPAIVVAPPKPAVQTPPPASDAGKTPEIVITPTAVPEPTKPVIPESHPPATPATPEPPRPAVEQATPPTSALIAEPKPVIIDTTPKPEAVTPSEPLPAKPALVEPKASVPFESKSPPIALTPAERSQESAKPAEPLAAEVAPQVQAPPISTETPFARLAEPKPTPTAEPQSGTAALPRTAETPVQAALVVTPQPFMSGSRLLVVGLLLLVVAGVLFFLIVRRSRAVGTPGSLITQSFDRDKKSS